MKQNMKRRVYEAPNAELLCLVPSTPIASWKWEGSDSSNWTFNHWGSYNPVDLLNVASAVGWANWLNDDLTNPDLK